MKIEDVVNAYLDGDGILEIAHREHVSTVKVRRILITAELWSSRSSEAVIELHEQGCSVKEIAERLCMSEKNVQAYLPYFRGNADGYGLKVSEAAQRCLAYRKRIERKKERSVHKGEEMKDMVKEERKMEPILIHSVLNQKDLNFQEQKDLMEYAQLGIEGQVMRDFLAPSDMTLYALHYALQAAYGWTNSHLHSFRLPEEKMRFYEYRIENWQEACGVLFRSPYMDEEGCFWMDDYKKGSFRNWLRSKYTGPYIHYNRWEDEKLCQKEARQAVKDWKNLEKENRSEREIKMPIWFDWSTSYEQNPYELLERLSIQELIDMDIRYLDYAYDYGDSWHLDISILPAVTVKDSLKARVMEEYRPVCVRRAGIRMIDDVGGMTGYVRFIRSLHMDEEIQKRMEEKQIDKDEAADELSDELDPYTDREGSLEWASIFDWKEGLQSIGNMF